jgi:beta-galactosidase
MGFFFQFDHYKMMDDLDFASYDSYPLGFLDEKNIFSESDKIKFHRTSLPDLAPFSNGSIFNNFRFICFRVCFK